MCRYVFQTLLLAASWLALPGLAADLPQQSLRFDRISVDDQPVEPTERHGSEWFYRLGRQPRGIWFTFGEPTGLASPPRRLRYRLGGHDADWRDLEGSIRLQFRFIDAQSHPVGSAEFPVSGQSEGWRGTIQNSPFTHRQEQLVVPSRAARVRIWMPSAGPAQTTGVRVLEWLRIWLLDPSQPGGRRELYHSQFDRGVELDDPLGVPLGWERDGTNLGIAQVVALPGPPARHGLAVIDDDLNGFGAWITAERESPQVTPGTTLQLEWSEAYSVGAGGRCSVHYRDFPPGQYQFRLIECDALGKPNGAELTAVILVPEPLWRAPGFLILASLTGAGGVFGTARVVARRRMRRQLHALEQQRLLEADRMRIARDLHDNLGAQLTRIGLLSELVAADSQLGEPSRKQLEQIFATTTEVARQLNEIVWAISPENDHLEPFAAYLCKQTQDLLAAAGLACRIQLPEVLPQRALSSAVRHNLFLAAREAVNNVIKHAGGTTVWLRLSVLESALEVAVEDDGTGWQRTEHGPCSPSSGGRGLANMQARMQAIGGTFIRESREPQGTRIRFQVPVQHEVGA